ncbi:MAG: phage holin family protein [Gemmatimonadota bacterium]|jgi:hypothetical protein|nr:phage holin family protein [Gemmatimonadota bacterium]
MNHSHKSRQRTPSSSEGGSIAELLRQLIQDATDLVRQEIRLAKLKVMEHVRRGTYSAALLGAGVVFLGVGTLVFIEFLVLGLGVLLNNRYWLSSLIVALLLMALGGGLTLWAARRFGDQFEGDPEPEKRTPILPARNRRSGTLEAGGRPPRTGTEPADRPGDHGRSARDA